ncbi:MAG TPA: hypothetical protein VE442_08410 [Jatrophihabitans sp.]|jgi:hypothetical protein|nr:hypothetical protein [Jatrophihabitans sp.]
MNEVLTGVLAFLGAGVGSALAYFAARAATRLEAAQGRREEWGRRFAIALEALTSSDDHTAAVGRALLDALLESELATDDDRRAALAVAEADATRSVGDGDLRLFVPIDQVDSVRIIEDNEIEEEDAP